MAHRDHFSAVKAASSVFPSRKRDEIARREPPKNAMNSLAAAWYDRSITIRGNQDAIVCQRCYPYRICKWRVLAHDDAAHIRTIGKVQAHADCASRLLRDAAQAVVPTASTMGMNSTAIRSATTADVES
jgi:hypothetical protein